MMILFMGCIYFESQFSSGSVINQANESKYMIALKFKSKSFHAYNWKKEKEK